MARKTTTSNGNGQDRLAEAMALLINNQAAFVGQLAESNRQLDEARRESAERFARIEVDMNAILRVLAEHGRILEEHSRILERLPDAVRDKIGFKAPQAGTPAAQP